MGLLDKFKASALDRLVEIALSEVASIQTTVETLFRVWADWIQERPFQAVGVAMIAAAAGHEPAARFVRDHQREVEQIIQNPASAVQRAVAGFDRNQPCNHSFFLINLLAISAFEAMAEGDEKAAWHRLRLAETEALLENGVFLEAQRLANQLLAETACRLPNDHPAVEVLRAVVAAKTIE